MNEVGSKSHRPLETITPLAAKIEIDVDLRFEKGQEIALATAISKIEEASVVLVCWQHENIGAIAKALSPTNPSIPNNWPGDRHNVIFRLDRADRHSHWVFAQVVPVMLCSDKSEQI